MSHRFTRLFSLLLAVVFTANALVPGHMHGCEMAERVSQHRATRAAEMGHSMHAMAMPGHESSMPKGGGQHHTAPGTQGDCHCVGHSCGATGVALPTTPSLPATVTVALRSARSIAQRVAPAAQPEHILPLSQAPPASLA
jgi:hypothetical protein